MKSKPRVSGTFLHIIEDSVDIAAPASRVFDVLTRTQEWRSWSTMLLFRGGEVRVGQKLQLGLRTANANYDFTAMVTDVVPNAAFEWLAKTGIPYIFDGRHRFEITPLDTKRCRLRNVEWYTGAIVPILRRTAMMRAAPAGFKAMNEEIRARAEQDASLNGKTTGGR